MTPGVHGRLGSNEVINIYLGNNNIFASLGLKCPSKNIFITITALSKALALEVGVELAVLSNDPGGE